jgi:diguanylate cyclase (GGDEF)-like protein/PAS domain S-box-containing protein
MFSRVDAASDIELEVERQKTALLYRNAGIALTVNIVNASLLAYADVTLGVTAGVALAWWCSVIAVVAGRFMLQRRYVASRPDAAAAVSWRNRYVAATGMVAAAWGAGSVLFMWNTTDGALVFTGLVFCGMAAGAVPILASVRTAFLTFALLIGIPMSAVIILQADSALDWAFGAMSVIFLLAVLGSARFLHQTLDRAIRLGLEKSRLLTNLERASRAAEAAVEASNLSLWDFDVGAGSMYLDENWPKIAGGAAGARVTSIAELVQAIHPEDRIRVGRAAMQAFKGVTPSFAEEIRVTSSSGERKWIMCRGKVLNRSPDGRATRAVGTNTDITHRKIDEEALAASENRFRQMFDRHNAVMLLVNAKSGRIADANTAALRFYGYTHEQLCAKSIQDINALPPEQIETGRDNAMTGQCNTFVFPHRLANGEMRTVEVHSTPIAVNDEDLLFSIVHDITQRRKAEQELVRESARNELFLKRASDGIHVLNAKGNVVEASDSFCAMLGYTKVEMLGMSIADLDARWNRGELESGIARLIALGSAVTFETVHRHRSGRLFDVEVSAVAIELDGEQLLYNSARDITERKRQLEAIRQAAGVFGNAHDGIIICDPEQRIVDVNPAFSRVTGYAKEEVVGRRPGFLASGRHDAAFYRAMQRSLKDRDFWEGEIWNRRRDGELYLERLYIAAIRDTSGTVGQYIGMFSDVTELRLQHEQLELLAHHDALTGLPNRVLLSDRMSQAIAKSRRSGKLMAVCYLDLDGFKAINDRFGHEAGDTLLIEVARRLKDAARGEDTVARLGGDEFVLLLASLGSIEQGQRAIVRMMEAIKPPLVLLDREISVTASLGATIFPDDSADPDSLLRHADQAMYLAKQSGKNCFKLFNPEHDRIARAHRETLGRVRRAIRDGELRLHYQPKVDMREGRLVGFEALVRWQHPELGLRLPGEFLPILMGTDCELELGKWVLKSAFDQMAVWCEAGHAFELSINVAASQLLHPDFVADLRGLLKEHELVPPNRIELEILETAALEDIGRATAVIHQCHSLGLRVALDDFGTGHSSLSYVRLLPVDTVKIDRLFIQGVPNDLQNVAVIECVLGLTRAFARRVIAEGVESAAEGTALVAMGCDIGQGFGIGRPMPADQVSDWLARWKRAPLRWDPVRKQSPSDVEFAAASAMEA